MRPLLQSSLNLSYLSLWKQMSRCCTALQRWGWRSAPWFIRLSGDG